jgi:hypothetical protein
MTESSSDETSKLLTLDQFDTFFCINLNHTFGIMAFVPTKDKDDMIHNSLTLRLRLRTNGEPEVVEALNMMMGLIHNDLLIQEDRIDVPLLINQFLQEYEDAWDWSQLDPINDNDDIDLTTDGDFYDTIVMMVRNPCSTPYPLPSDERYLNSCGLDLDCKRFKSTESPEVISKMYDFIHGGMGSSLTPEEIIRKDPLLIKQIFTEEFAKFVRDKDT